MAISKVYSAFKFQIYPLQLFIILIGFIIGVIIGSLNDKKRKHQQQPQTKYIQYQLQQRIIKQNNQSPQHLILSYSLSTGQSFQTNGIRSKMFKGHLYQFLALQFRQSQQGFPTSYQISKSGITKTSKDGQWIKLYNTLMKVPAQGKYYFNVYVVKNEYFVKRQASQKASTLAISRTDCVIGFFMAKKQDNVLKLSEQIDTLCQQSERESNNIEGISAYGFNGRIYNNGDLRTEQKIVKKNKQFTVLINRDDGFIGYEIEGQTIGFSILPKQRCELIPFVEMFAVGSSIIISS